MLIYNIACQYVVHLQDCIGHLLPADLILDAAIGFFHVHGHQEACFFRYATTFIPGAAVVAGEILESLWAVLNAVTPAMRMATLAHHAEIMDNHMTDSNHKKCLGMGERQAPQCLKNKPIKFTVASLCARYDQLKEMSAAADTYYRDIAGGIDSADINIWEIEVSAAESERMTDRAVMDIIGARKDVSVPPAEVPHAPTSRGTVFHWIQLALELEEQQWV